MSDQTERPQALLDDRWAESGYPHALRPELHKALMARGIDYWVTQGITFWNRDDGCECLAYGYRANGVPKLAIKVVGFTDPEQAIAATLGDSDTTGARQRDAVEVVRCRDCAHAVVSRPFYTFAGRPADIEVWRCDYFWNVDEPPEVEPDGFCAWGRRADG